MSETGGPTGSARNGAVDAGGGPSHGGRGFLPHVRMGRGQVLGSGLADQRDLRLLRQRVRYRRHGGGPRFLERSGRAARLPGVVARRRRPVGEAPPAAGWLGRSPAARERSRALANPRPSSTGPGPSHRRAGVSRLARHRDRLPDLRVAGGVRWRAGRPTETLCPACGAESGIDDLGRPGDWDALHGIRARRGYWAAVGCPWAVPAARPATWDLIEQLARLPDAWR